MLQHGVLSVANNKPRGRLPKVGDMINITLGDLTYAAIVSEIEYDPEVSYGHSNPLSKGYKYYLVFDNCSKVYLFDHELRDRIDVIRWEKISE